MRRKITFGFAVFLLVALALTPLTARSAVTSNAVGDVTDALVATMRMRSPVEHGNLTDTEQTGNEAISLTEKAANNEKDSGRKEKLNRAVSLIKEVLSYARQGAWSHADASLKRALALLDEVNG